jgi:sugar phosphate isomerase/epimerase
MLSMSKIILAVNNCFALGRYPEPEEWLRIVRDELGLRNVQFSYDLLDPVIIEEELFREKCCSIKAYADKYQVAIDTAITGEVPHKFNALMDPDPGLRRCYLRWYERMVRGGSLLGAEASGVYLGTMSRKDYADPVRHRYLIEVLLEQVVYLTGIAQSCGQDYFLWEPMSIPREVPCTIDQTKMLIDNVNEHSHLPVRVCLDVGHGYMRSGDPRDSDPYAWLRELGNRSPIIHMQQTDGKGSRHWPFSEEYNKIGIIKPEKVLEIIEKAGSEKTAIVFEFFYSAHAIPDESALDNLKLSVEYWQRAMDHFFG